MTPRKNQDGENILSYTTKKTHDDNLTPKNTTILFIIYTNCLIHLHEGLY